MSRRARTPERSNRPSFFKANKLFHPVINNPQDGYYIFMNPTENFIDSQNRLRESIVNNICTNYNIQQIFINPQDEVRSQGDSDGDLNPALLSKWIPNARGNNIQGDTNSNYKYYEQNYGNNKTTFILPSKQRASALWASVIKLLSFDNYLSYGYELDDDGNPDESGHVCNGTLSPGFFDTGSFDEHAFIILYYNKDNRIKQEKINKFIKLLTYNKNDHSNTNDEVGGNESMAKQMTQMFGWEILFNKAGFNTENYLPPIEGDDIGNDIVEYLNAGDSTNRQVDIYKTKLENALKKAPWHNFFGKLNLGAILCVKDSYEGQRAVGYLDKDKMQYLYIDTICSHPTAGKASRRQPQHSLGDYPTINNVAGSDIYNNAQQSPGMELVDMTNIIGYYCRIPGKPLSHLYSATKLSSLTHVIKFYYQKFGFRFYSTTDGGKTWGEYNEQASIDKTTNTLPRLKNDGWASMSEYSDLFTKINKDPNTVPAFDDLHHDFSWRNQWSDDWNKATAKASFNTNDLLKKTEERLERVGFDDQGFTMFLMYDRIFMEKYSEQYLTNNIPRYDSGNKQGQLRLSPPTIKILTDEALIFESNKNMKKPPTTIDNNSRRTVCENCTVQGGGKRKRTKTRRKRRKKRTKKRALKKRHRRTKRRKKRRCRRKKSRRRKR